MKGKNTPGVIQFTRCFRVINRWVGHRGEHHSKEYLVMNFTNAGTPLRNYIEQFKTAARYTFVSTSMEKAFFIYATLEKIDEFNHNQVDIDKFRIRRLYDGNAAKEFDVLLSDFEDSHMRPRNSDNTFFNAMLEVSNDRARNLPPPRYTPRTIKPQPFDCVANFEGLVETARSIENPNHLSPTTKLLLSTAGKNNRQRAENERLIRRAEFKLIGLRNMRK